MTQSEAPRILQICHGYDGPFMDCARQYASLFEGTPYRVTTLYLSGAPDEAVVAGSASDEVIFLGYSSKEMSGLKLEALRRVRQLVAEGDYRLVIAHRFKSLWVACLGTRLPVIGVNHAFGVYGRWSRRLFAGLFRSRIWLLGVSRAVRDDIRNCLPSWSPQRIQHLYNRIDVPALQARQFDRVTARAALSLPETAWVVGNVGRLHADKDQKTLIRGFAAALPGLPADSLLAIMGSGRLEGELRALAAELGIAERVRFLGQVPEGSRYFKAFDLFALSSDHEPFGMVLLEAMAADVPLICSDCGGGREVVEDVGLLFPLADAAALAARLQQVSRYSAPELQSLLERSRQRLQTMFSDAAVRSQFAPLYAQLLGAELQ